MEQSSLFSVYSALSLRVSDLTRYLRQLLESDQLLSNVWVQGEISNLSRPSSGHIYFTLKDESAALKCVIWRSNAMRIRGGLQNGMAIEAHGSIGVYERDGAYQLYVDGLRLSGDGVGWLYQEFLRLKALLESEGLFDEARKRPLPAHPRVVGIVTSPTGAALQDMLNTLRGRYALCEVIIAPTLVQGDDAPLAICRALQAINDLCHPDVILLARGGGSLEDLWAFNDERVVRAVVASAAPVVTGIGHETDFTLCDFAADLRAPTPTGAAVLCTPDGAELRRELAGLHTQLLGALEDVLLEQGSELRSLRHRLERLSPAWQVENGRQRLDELFERAQRAVGHSLALKRTRTQAQAARWQALNPLAVLRRGYAVVTDGQGRVVTSVAGTAPGAPVRVRLADGTFGASVQDVQPDSHGAGGSEQRGEA
jgi:exodeoxyribonuclease VII large subunit